MSAPVAAGPRIASLVPSVTELLFALGLGPWVVARTGFCIHPAGAVDAVPKVGGTKDVALDRLRALAPTHVVANVDENRRETIDAISAWPDPPQLLVNHPCRPADNLVLIDQLAGAFGALPGVHGRALALRAACEDALAATQPEAHAPQRVLYLIWREPWMTVARDTWIAALLARVNWQTWPPVDGGPHGAARYPVLRGDEPWLQEIDQVLLSSEPYRFDERHVAEAQALCPRARVRSVDGELIGWYGARLPAALAHLRALAG